MTCNLLRDGPSSQDGHRHAVDLDGRTVPLRVTRHPRARRYILRVTTEGDALRLTLPPDAPLDDALKFVRKHSGWALDKMRERQNRVPFEAGAMVPVRGVLHRIAHEPGCRTPVSIETAAPAPMLRVGGDLRHLSRRLADWLAKEARADLQAAVSRHTDTLGLSYRRIVVRDQKSRWGSCSTTGTLSFSWRLVMAPPHVLDYVAAHEVAHLREMNHGRGFWRLVEQLCPGFETSRRWLRTYGARLHRYGP